MNLNLQLALHKCTHRDPRPFARNRLMAICRMPTILNTVIATLGVWGLSAVCLSDARPIPYEEARLASPVSEPYIGYRGSIDGDRAAVLSGYHGGVSIFERHHGTAWERAFRILEPTDISFGAPGAILLQGDRL